MGKRYRVTLDEAEREQLGRLLSKAKADVRRLKHAQILLKADEAEGGPAWADVRIAEAVGCGTCGRSPSKDRPSAGMGRPVRRGQLGDRLPHRR